VHRGASRLVHDQQRVVFVDHRQIERRRGLLRAPGEAHRRNPHAIPRLQAVGRIDAAAVDPHFAAAQDAVDMTARHPLTDAKQKVIHALAFARAIDLDRQGVA